MKSDVTLLALDIEGEWNVPLLRNAAEMSGAALLFAHADGPSNGRVACSASDGDSTERPPRVETAGDETPVDDRGKQQFLTEPMPHIDELLGRFNRVIACEATKQSRSIYDYPAPRGHVAVIVGNELRGVPKRLLKKVDQVVSIPMYGRGMSSFNVAAAAAIALYSLERDLGRKRLRPSSLTQRSVDVLLVGPRDSSELGSLLRSAWAFGWKRVFLDDPHGVWFSEDRATILAGRAAARREVNPLVVASAAQIDLREYDSVMLCDGQSQGSPLSRLSLPSAGKLLLVYGEGDPARDYASAERIFVDHKVSKVGAGFRHAGSILLSVISHILRRR